MEKNISEFFLLNSVMYKINQVFLVANLADLVFINFAPPDKSMDTSTVFTRSCYLGDKNANNMPGRGYKGKDKKDGM